jgi:hypothetical protein
MNDYPTVWGASPNPPAPRGPSRVPRWLAIGGLALAFTFALGVGVLIGSGTLPSFANSASPDLSAVQQHGSLGAAGNAGFAGVMHGFGGGLAVQSVGANSITATRTGRNGASTNVTINTTTSTQYLELGKTIDRSAIVKGTKIGVKGTKNSDGSITATRIEVILPSYYGAVTGVSGGDITIKDPKDSSTHVIHTNSGTAFTRGGQSSSLSAVATNENIVASGTLNSDNSLTAKAVRIVLPHAGGQITAINGSDVTVKTRGGTSTIHLQSGTTYYTVTKGTSGPTQTAASKSDLAVGTYIEAEGTKNSDGSLNAETVRILPAPSAGKSGAPRHGGRGWGGHGG